MKHLICAALMAGYLSSPVAAQTTQSASDELHPFAVHIGETDDRLTAEMAQSALKKTVNTIAFILFHEGAADTLSVYLLVRDPNPENVVILDNPSRSAIVMCWEMVDRVWQVFAHEEVVAAAAQ